MAAEPRLAGEPVPRGARMRGARADDVVADADGTMCDAFSIDLLDALLDAAQSMLRWQW